MTVGQEIYARGRKILKDYEAVGLNYFDEDARAGIAVVNLAVAELDSIRDIRARVLRSQLDRLVIFGNQGGTA